MSEKDYRIGDYVCCLQTANRHVAPRSCGTVAEIHSKGNIVIRFEDDTTEVVNVATDFVAFAQEREGRIFLL